ncbi:MAG: hypothetical protein KDI56_14990 [Xanthomonadales bacterium]|nr:hypothetical protein [Xanthomonadales bacterium]MCB1628347.1 hypothetical protein [Xanthomonadales bacterium]
MITDALRALHGGCEAEAAAPLGSIYALLRGMAARQLRQESAACTLRPTELVHEAWLRLGPERQPYRHRGHFFGSAAQAMRRILVERARSRMACKRGEGASRTEFDARWPSDLPSPEELSHIDIVLAALERQDAELARVVCLRCFGGFTVSEIAQIDGVAERTVFRQWATARGWLEARLRPSVAVLPS